ncbi:MAG: hypothetical protein GX295_08645, partial [Syntrophomonadaceae bacterium]|nr:hypothetical protein [Syntrophomonadaceae bacterium]
GLIMETSGTNDEVIKLMPPLIIDEVGLNEGLKILKDSLQDTRIQYFIQNSTKRKQDFRRKDFLAIPG